MDAPSNAPIRSAEAPPEAGVAPRKRVVVVGTGHAGMEAVRALRKAPVDVLLVDRNNYHKFQPLLYQVGTAGLQAGDITQPARHLFQDQDNADFQLGTVVGVDLDVKQLRLDAGRPIWYDYLILATGASTDYYGIEGAQAHAFPLKNVPDAVNLRSHILAQFEETNRNPGLIESGALTFGIVGGGATGVEMAGALIELIDRVLVRDYPGLDVARARVVLLEQGDALMPSYAPELRAYTKRVLEERSVEVLLDTSVQRVTPTEVYLSGHRVLRTRTLVWAAGVRANPLADLLGVEQTDAGRIVVNETLRIPGERRVFVAGDLAGARDEEGELYPQLAQVAIQQGRHAAHTIERLEAGREPEPFRYRDLGMMATIGRNAAIGQFPSGRTLKGWIAWYAWAIIHIVKLVGFRNRLSVLSSWVYNYLTYDRGARLILPAFPESDDLPDAGHPPRRAAQATRSTEATS